MINASGGSSPTQPTNQTSSVTPMTGPGFPTHNPAIQQKQFMTTASQENPGTIPNPVGATPPAPPKFPDPTKNLVKVTDEKSDSIPSGSNGNGDTTKPKRKLNLKMIVGVVVLLLVVLGSGAGFFLSQQQQDLRQQAYTPGGPAGCCRSDSDCPGTEKCRVANGACAGFGDKSCAEPESQIRSVCRNNACSQQVCVPGSGSANCTDPTCSTNEECEDDQEPPPPSNDCRDGSGTIVWCATFDCSTTGDVNGDGQCTSADGVSPQIRDGNNCPTPNKKCGQIDQYKAPVKGQNWGSWCGTTFHDMSECDDGGGGEPNSKTVSGKVYCGLEDPSSPLYLIKNVPVHSIDSTGHQIGSTKTAGNGTYSMSVKPVDGAHIAVRVSQASGTAGNKAFRGTGSNVCGATKHENCEFSALASNQADMNFETTVAPKDLVGTYDNENHLIITWNKAVNYDNSKVDKYILRLDYDESQDPGVNENTWKPGTLAEGGNKNDYWRYVDNTVGTCDANKCTVDTRIFNQETGDYKKPWKPGKYFININPVANSTPPSGGEVIELCRSTKTVDYTPEQPVSKTWNVTTQFICEDNTIIPTQIGRRLVWGVSPSPITWGYEPGLSGLAEGTTEEITKAITVNDILASSTNYVYVGLYRGSLLENWLGNTYQAINPPNGVTSGTYLSPATNMFRWSVQRAAGNLTLKFRAPAELCISPFCGDGEVGENEECDDGNEVDTDACTNACTTPICGDGIVRTGVEECDDGNTIDNDECSNACTTPICGDGIVQDPETCDDGELNSDTDPNACRTDCSLPICGDGILDNGESCDDGNTVDDDECTNTCTLPNCGDSIIQDPEQCDDGNTDETDECRLCRTPYCGDGVVDDDESCDDGNSDNRDECRNNCEEPSCGDGIRDEDEACDDGNTASGDGCSSSCENEVTEETTIGCNDSCVTNADCSDINHICVTTEDATLKCRLSEYPTSTSCTAPVSQPTLPPELPETGPADWLNWLKAGLVTLGLGTALFFLL